MHRHLSCIVLTLFLLWLIGCHHGQVRLQVSPDSTSHEWRNTILPDQFFAPYRNLLYVVEAPVGYAAARHRPLEGVTLSIRTRWNAIVSSLCDCFNELRLRHNEARTTIREFDKRYAELLATAKDMTNKKAALDAALGGYSAAKTALEAGPPREGEEKPEQVAGARARMEESRIKAEDVVLQASQLVAGLKTP